MSGKFWRFRRCPQFDHKMGPLSKEVYTPGSTDIAIARKWGTRILEDVYISYIKIGDIPASYVSLPEGSCYSSGKTERSVLPSWKQRQFLGICEMKVFWEHLQSGPVPVISRGP